MMDEEKRGTRRKERRRGRRAEKEGATRRKEGRGGRIDEDERATVLFLNSGGLAKNFRLFTSHLLLNLSLIAPKKNG